MTTTTRQHSDMISANAEAIEAWNTVLFDKFLRFRHLVDGALGRHGEALLEQVDALDGLSALDIGCGFGETTLDLGDRVGAAGTAVGIDAAPRFIDEARRAADRSGRDNVRFAVADAQVDPLGADYDLAFSRFGTMFFASPVLALRNIRRSLRAGATLAMVVWRAKAENEFVRLPEERVAALVDRPTTKNGVTCGPGPFSMADPDTLRVILAAAGFTSPSLCRHDAQLCIGRDLDEAVSFALEIGPAGELLRLAGESASDRIDAVIASLRDGLRPMVRADGGVYAGSSAWLVTARAG